MSENPYEASAENSAENSAANEDGRRVSEGKATYNVVSDTITGVNLRGSDNKFQAKFTAASTLVLALLGALLAWLNPSWKLPWFAGALVGGFCGLVFGVFASGIFLMFYRAARHLQGKHD